MNTSIGVWSCCIPGRARRNGCTHTGYLLRTDLLGAQAQLRAAARGKLARHGQITSDFPKSCQARESKIFCFRSHANHRHNSACLTADEGRWPSSRTRGEMRWTRELRLTCAPDAYGEVVWFGRRGAGAKLRGVYFLRGDGGKRAVLRGEHEVSRKAIAQGRPECSRCPVCSCAVFVCANRTRDRGCSKHPVFPAPSIFDEGKRRCKPRAISAARTGSCIRVG